MSEQSIDDIKAGAEPEAPEGSTPEPVQTAQQKMDLDERRKRQEAERREQTMQMRLQELQEKYQQLTDNLSAKERPDPKEDLEGYLTWKDTQTQQEIANAEFRAAERFIRKEYPNWKEIRADAELKMNHDPVFKQSVMSLAPGDRPEYIANYMANEQKVKEVGNLDDLKAQLRKEIMDELSGSMPNLANARSTAGNDAHVQQSIRDILGR